MQTRPPTCPRRVLTQLRLQTNQQTSRSLPGPLQRLAPTRPHSPGLPSPLEFHACAWPSNLAYAASLCVPDQLSHPNFTRWDQKKLSNDLTLTSISFLSSSVRAAITEYHRWGSLSTTDVSISRFWSWSPRSGSQHGRVGAALLGCHPHKADGARGLPAASCTRARISFLRGSPS